MALRVAYNGLLQAVRQGGTSVDQDDKQDPPAKREDYPDVQFWTRRNWLDRSMKEDDAMVLDDNTCRRGKSRASQGVNVAMRYVETDGGVVVDGHRCAEMRRLARSIWVHMANNGGLPTSWRKADVKLSQSYCREMCRKFPELRLCDLDWKADQIATDNYPSWYKNWTETVQKAGGMKQEQEDQTLSDTGVPSNLKRPNTQPPDHTAKKSKVNTDLPEPAKMEVDTSTTKSQTQAFQVSTTVVAISTFNNAHCDGLSITAAHRSKTSWLM
jgi:hypothetical protein